MDTEIRIFPETMEAEVETLWQAVCQILGVEPGIIKKPTVKWATDQGIDLAVQGARFAALGPDKNTIHISSESDVYRGHLAHEMAHYIRWHLAGYDESEYWPKEVDKLLYQA